MKLCKWVQILWCLKHLYFISDQVSHLSDLSYAGCCWFSSLPDGNDNSVQLLLRARLFVTSAMDSLDRVTAFHCSKQDCSISVRICIFHDHLLDLLPNPWVPTLEPEAWTLFILTRYISKRGNRHDPIHGKYTTLHLSSSNPSEWRWPMI